ncbi:MAG TPA: DUF488 domain-containing protein [Candidatus Saccharimonadales bacterium]|jgi:uncharacterized protein YeaO (DUF488 family)|nr:DUF488 domain-containing protein [Candidatus Saccharimonadales bacterium]
MLKLKRTYDPADSQDGYRVLVDRLWPRGISKEKAKVDLWMKEIAPSDALRKWFGHDPERWMEFQARYGKELQKKGEFIKEIRQLEKKYRTVTLLYSAKEELHNQAVALLAFLNKRG